jgi:virginiamycin B lyase
MTPAILLTATISIGALGASAQTALPNGAAKDVVETACSACHQLNIVTNAGHTPEEWNRIVGDMMMKGANISASQMPGVAQYLASNFPPKARPQGAIVTGSVQATIREWAIPSRPFPHDPYAAADGSVWYTGMGGNLLGRLDPKTGQFKEYPLKTVSSGPHGLVADK